MESNQNYDYIRPTSASRPAWQRYVVTLLAEIAITAALLALHPLFPLGGFPITYVFVIMLVAYAFGDGPAIVAFVVGLALFDYYFVAEGHASLLPAQSAEDWARLVAFLLGTSVVGLAALLIRKSRQRADELTDRLRQSGERTSSILESIADAFFALDHEWRFAYVNAEAASALLKTREELLGNVLWDVFPEVVGTQFERAYRAAVAEGVTKSVEDYYAPLRGWFEIRAYPSADGLSVYFRDVTTRRELQQTLERYRLLMQRARDIVLVIDFPGGGILEVNDAAVEAYGFSREEMMSMTVTDLRAPEERRDAASQILEADARGVLFETLHLRRDGSTFPVEVSSQGANLGDRRIIFSIVRDITERKQAEEELRDSRERLARIMDTIPGGIISIDRQGRVRFANPGALAVLRVTAEEMERRGFDSAEWGISTVDGQPLPPEDLPFARVLSTGRPVYDFEHAIGLPGGARAILSISAAPLRNARGELVEVVVSLTDVTEITGLREALEHQVSLLQRALAPSRPIIGDGYKVAAAYQPAFAHQEVGGDFYDVFRTEDGQIGILVGDVSGKGIEAAALAAATRSTVRAFAYELCDPDLALTHGNSVLCSQRDSTESFVTLLLIVLDPKTGRMLYSGAGHPPALIRRAAGVVEQLASGDPPIGIWCDRKFTGSESYLGPGDKLVLYTDGVMEARRGMKMFEVAGIARVLADQGQSSVEELVSSIVNTASEWAGGHIHDDVAVLALERPPDA